MVFVKQKTTKICDNCGAECNIRDTYCKKCSNPFPVTSMVPEDTIIDGLDNIEAHQFIDKNAGYYLGKFEKSNGKKWFVQLNWAAFIFGPTWFFYRKMYKIAVIYLAVAFAVSMLFSVTMPVVFKNAVKEYAVAQEEYEKYSTANEYFKYKFDENGTTNYEYTPLWQRINDDLNEAKGKINLMYFFIYAPPIIFETVFRLFGNAFYKQYVTENVGKKAGGTSWAAALIYYFGGDIATSVISLLISIFILR